MKYFLTAIISSLCLLLTCPIFAQIDSIDIRKPGTTIMDWISFIEQDTTVVNDTTEDNSFGRWMNQKGFWIKRVTTTDSSGDDMFTTYFKALNESLNVRFGVATKSTSSGSCAGNGFSGAWGPLGETEMDKQVNGFGTCVWAKADQSIILEGSFSGLFRSTDQGDLRQKGNHTHQVGNPYFSNLLWVTNYYIYEKQN